MSGPGRHEALLAEDAAARARALDVTRSFLVQAPAGSGKTELLIQRLLALLGTAERPERVLAITFTRKAAGEMRDRVVRALVAAGDPGVDERALRPHERLTRRLARAVLAQDAREGWNLIEHPSRLAIQTIDALAQAIALQAPLASGLPPAPRFTDDARPLHLAAARAAIAAADPRSRPWRLLLDHQDNDADALAALIAEMLAKRDQWLTLVRDAPGTVRDVLERTLAREVEGELALASRTLAQADFAPLARFAAIAHPNLGDADALLRAALEACIERGGAPPVDAAHLDHWRAIVGWLLTRDGKDVRKSASGLAGIPPVGDGPGKEARSSDAKAAKAWLASLGATAGLVPAFKAILALPPTRYTDEEWDRIEALLSLLPTLAAHLETVFAEAREMDFPKATLAALAALGDGDEPTDLLLRLDLRIDHLLVDEFQDTSYAHLELIRRLVSGWAEGDGRTLFAVGDPMQSIYRFRGAEVRAFVDAQASGVVEGVAVERLALRRNFRSQAGLVDWANATFPDVLGTTNDPWQGRVAFAEAAAVEPADDGRAWTLDVAGSDEEEAAKVVARVREGLASGGSVAILVRARTHLGALLPALRDASIPYSAVDLDVLADRPAVRDVVALAHAIVQPDDRLAWLAVLRAPWCGLSLADLHAIVRAAGGPHARTIEEVVLDPPGTLSPGGAARLAACAAAIREARRTHGHAPLVERVRAAWLALAGPATLDEPLDLVAVGDVLALVAAHERAGDMPDWSAFTARLAEQRLSPPPGEEARVQVMTMHKAKGLEFDTVILPGLARGRTRSDAPLMRWRTRRDGLLVGLARPKGGEHDGVYAYLRALGTGEEAHELARLAYVACTRAKRRLALVAVCDRDDGGAAWKEPGKASILGLLGGSVLGSAPPPGDGPEATPTAPAPRATERLPAGWRPDSAPAPLVHASAQRTVESAPPFDWARERARRLGVVAHLLLAQVAADGLARWDDATLAAQSPRIQATLIEEGALPGEAAAEAVDVRATVAAALRDPRGRWLFDPAHEDARSEWALAGVIDGDIVHVVLDRTFVDAGARWIVDFKTGTHEGSEAAAFLDAEVERYRPQLERYARIVSALDARPIRLALYHPRVPGGWREVTR
ncbi:ATP-dependent DNA helicase PcrA [Burkholderiales bacterium]|nr:ATP-dependent DNA helicase PcrA [Burkholderiales bacterium]